MSTWGVVDEDMSSLGSLCSVHIDLVLCSHCYDVDVNIT